MSRNYMTTGAIAIVVAMAGAYHLGEAAQTAVDEHQNSSLVLSGDVALWPVATADYTLLKTIYEEFPSESQQMYETYRAAFAKNLALASGSVVMDMSKPTP